MQDEVSKKDSVLQKFEMDMGNLEEQRRKTDDNVSSMTLCERDFKLYFILATIIW